MKLSTSSMGGFGVLFAEDFDDDGSMLLACEAPVPPTPEIRERREGPDPATETFSAADLAQARRAGHDAGFAEGVASASEAASVTQASLLATMTERFAAARHDGRAGARRHSRKKHSLRGANFPIDGSKRRRHRLEKRIGQKKRACSSPRGDADAAPVAASRKHGID